MPLVSIENEIETEEESSHIIHLWTPFSLEVTQDYDFVPNGFLFQFASTALSYFAYGVLTILNKIWFHFSVNGKENLKSIKGGKITISNHIHPIDCTMCGIANFPNPTFFPTLESNFGIPVVRHIIRLLHAIPIPERIGAKSKFIQEMNQLLKNGKTIHFYPEGSLWPYYNKLRHFKDGAFKFAVENDVPIVPMVYTLKENTGIYKYFKKKPQIHLTILEPIYPNNELNKNAAIEDLKKQSYDKMNAILKK